LKTREKVARSYFLEAIANTIRRLVHIEPNDACLELLAPSHPATGRRFPWLINPDPLTLNGGTIGAGAVIKTSDGTAIVSGTVSSGGTLFAKRHRRPRRDSAPRSMVASS
jgi:hypothetical protein